MFKSKVVLTIAMVGFVDLANSIHVRGNRLIDDTTNQPITLQGFSHSGTEFACIAGYGMFDGPNDDASIEAMKTWNINVVRVPMNEHCWLGINGVKPEYSGENYKQALG